MSLTVEDGTGLADADAFVSLEDCDTYCTAHGLTAWTGEPSSPADLKEAAIRRATAYLSNSFTWKGSRLNGRAQALAWPRSDVEDEEGETVASDEVPVEVVSACCEIASRELATPGFMTPDVTLTDRVKREKIGPIETEYATTPLTAEAAKPIVSLVTDLIGGLLATTSSSLVGTAVRR